MQKLSDELSFQRLLHRCKIIMSRDGLSKNLRKLECAATLLNAFYVKMQDSSIDQDILMQYGRELSSLRSLLEVENRKTIEEKLEAMNRLPKTFPGENQQIRQRKKTENENFDDEETDEKVSNSVIKAQNEEIYKADIRRQLLSGSKNLIENEKTLSEIEFLSYQENQHAELSEELLRLTTALKTNVQIAGSVVKEDNQTISAMTQLADQNREDLGKESQRLEKYTKRSCMDWMMILTVMLVIWVFLLCVLVMKFFKKRI